MPVAIGFALGALFVHGAELALPLLVRDCMSHCGENVKGVRQ